MGYVMGIYVMLWVFKGCVYKVCLCYGYLRGVVMLCEFKGCGYVMGI